MVLRESSSLENRKLTKHQAISNQLEAAIYLSLKKFLGESVHTLIFAARGILLGLHQHSPNPFLLNWDEKIGSRIIPGKEKEWHKIENRVSNFLKHADKDPQAEIHDVDLEGLNNIEILICILAFWSIQQPITSGLFLGLVYFGATNESWFALGV